MENIQNIKRGDVFYADLSLFVGSEQGGIRPVVVLQNDIGNKFSPTVIVAIITSKVKKEMPTHVYLNAIKNGLNKDSYAILEQIRTIDKRRLIEKIGQIDHRDMMNINNALLVSVGLSNEQSINNQLCFA